MADPSLLRISTGLTGVVVSATAWSDADGRTVLVSAVADGTIVRWDATTGEALGAPLTGHTGSVEALLTWSDPDGRTSLASAGVDGTIRRWDASTGEPLGEPITGHVGWVLSITTWTGPDGRTLLASTGTDGTIRRWDATTGEPLGPPITGHAGWVLSITTWTDPDGRTLLASAGEDGTIRRWNATTGEALGPPITAHVGRVMSITTWTDPDGHTLLASAGEDGTVRRWNATTGEAIGEPITHSHPLMWATVWTDPDGRTTLASAGTNGAIHRWDAGTGEPLGEPLTGHAGRVTSVTTWRDPDGRRLLATAESDGTIRRWDVATGEALGAPGPGRTGSVWALTAWSDPDGRAIVASSGQDGTIRRWDATTGEPAGEPITGHTGSVWALTNWTDADGRRLLASAGTDATIRRWDATTGEPLGEPITGHERDVMWVTAWTDHDGRTLLVSAGNDGTIRRWDATTGAALGQPINGHAGEVWALTAWIDADGRTLLASGGQDGLIRRWDATTGEPLGRPMIGHAGEVMSLTAWTATDGRAILASGGSDGTIRRWEAGTGEPFGAAMIGHTGSVWAVPTWTDADGRRLLASAGGDGTVRRWNATTGARAFGRPLRPHRDSVLTAIVLDRPGRGPALVTGGQDGDVVIQDAEATAPPRRTTDMLAHLDDDAVEDVLGRDVLAAHLDGLLTRLTRQAQSTSAGRAVVVHLDGRWGAGKSTLLTLLTRRLREPTGVDDREGITDPIVVRYDAWRENAVAPQWWSLGRAIHAGVQGARVRPTRWLMTAVGAAQRLVRSLPVLVAVVVVTGFVVAAVRMRSETNQLPGWVATFTTLVAAATSISALALVAGKSLFWAAPAFGRLHARSDDNPLGAIATTVAGLRRWSPRGRSQTAADLVLTVGIAAAGVATWAALVDRTGWAALGAALAITAALYQIVWLRISLDRPRRPILLAIDDLDRCHADRVVALIETVHTLLREPADVRRLRRWRRPAALIVIVLVEGRWVRCSFETVYKDFESLRSPVHGLGSDFLHKVFDHTVLVPALSPEQTQRFVDHLADTPEETLILRGRRQVPTGSPSTMTTHHTPADVLGPPSSTASAAVSGASGGPARTQRPAPVLGSPPVIPDGASSRASALADLAAVTASEEDFEELTEHLLTRYTSLLPPNPRLIKRVANTWSMLTAVQQHVQNEADEDTVVRAALMYVRFPALVDDLLEREQPPVLAIPERPEDRLPWHRAEVLDLLTRDDGSPLDLATLARCYGRTFSARATAAPPLTTATTAAPSTTAQPNPSPRSVDLASAEGRFPAR